MLLSPFGKWRCSSLEQTCINVTQGCFAPSLVEIGRVVLVKYFEKKILNFLLLSFILSFIWTNMNHFHPRMFCLKLAQWFWGNRINVYADKDDYNVTATPTPNNGKNVIRKAHLSLQLRKANKVKVFYRYRLLFYVL